MRREEFSSVSFFFEQRFSNAGFPAELRAALTACLDRWDRACREPFFGAPWELLETFSRENEYMRALIEGSIARRFWSVVRDIEHKALTETVFAAQGWSGRWWRIAASTATSLLREARRRLHALGSSYVVSDALERLDLFGERVTRLIVSGAPAETFYNVAGYCAFAGDAFLRRGELLAAILSWHRMLDLTFQGQLYESGLVRETRDTLRFVDPEDGKRVALAPAYFALRRASLIAPPSGVEAKVEECNNTRNRLLLTHGIRGVALEEALPYRQDAYLILKNLFPLALERVLDVRQALSWSFSLHPGVLFISPSEDCKLLPS